MQPLVSVLMITHNHAPFITRSIESVLSQQTSFGVELVIGEDASTDSTKEIIQSFSSQYPEKIFTVHHDKNIGMGRNFFDTLSRCRGKYIALLDGDDRWINDKKLQIQADFLEQNRNVVACGGNSISESNKKAKGYLVKWMKSLIPVKMEEYDREEMIISNRFRTLTVLARTDAFKLTEKEIINSPVLDWPLFISLTNNNILNKYVNLPHYFGAYNVHDGGVFSGSSFTSRLKSSLQAREAISAITHDRYLGWHFPVCSLANREHYNEELLKRHYKELFLNDPEIYLNDDVFAIMKK
ncbi:MAG: glycosyltransferase, partial [Verrucomicrobiaceae bacterium]